MAMPINDKTWVFDVNNEVQTGAYIDDVRSCAYSFYNNLITFGCTPMGCSWWNGSVWAKSVPGDGIKDGRWTDPSELHWRVSTNQSGPQGWAVLRLPTGWGNGTTEIMFQLYAYGTAYYSNINTYIAYAGYNIEAATINARPAINSGTEVNIAYTATTNYNSGFIPAGTSKKIWNTATSSDNTCFRFWTMSQGFCVNLIELSRIKNPVPGLTAGGLTDDWWLLYNHTAQSTAADRPTYARMYNAATTYTYGFVTGGSTYTNYDLTGECRLGASVPIAGQFELGPNPLDSNSYPLLPIGMSSTSNSTYAYGKIGEVYDMWWGSSSLVNGTTFPGDGSKTHIMLGNAIVIPWDTGVVPVIT